MQKESITPPKISLLFLTVVSIFIGLIFIFPSGKISIGSLVSLNFYKVDDLFPNKQEEIFDLSQITEKAETLKEVSQTQVYDKKDFSEDTLDSHSNQFSIDTCFIPKIIKPKPEQLVFIDQKIEIPPGNPDALRYFYNGLDMVIGKKNQVRILHYGDSQLEGDRITSSLRKLFHQNKNFNGCGVGLVPLKENPYGRKTLIQQSSENLVEYSIFSDNTSRYYGLLGSIYKFKSRFNHSYTENKSDTISYKKPLKVLKEEREGESVEFVAQVLDSSNSDTVQSLVAESINSQISNSKMFGEKNNYVSGEIILSRHGKLSDKSQQPRLLKLLYSNVAEPFEVKVLINEKLASTSHIEPNKGFSILEWPIKQAFQTIKISFQGNNSPDFYGASLDCNSGVAVDNIGIRGASMVNFKKMHPGNLSNMLDKLNVKLVVLQFGVNVVPYVSDDYGYYENMIYRDIMALKKANPEISVLVVGVSDMAKKNGLNFESYPNIEKIRDAQRSAAFRSGSAFWDLYTAMGGRNSMVSWVQNDPAYASNDYTHFNNRGANVIGRMIYDALIYNYYEFKEVL